MPREYVKDCDCVGATASGPREFFHGPVRCGDGWQTTAGWSNGPVCDTCDKPWREVFCGREKETVGFVDTGDGQGDGGAGAGPPLDDSR